MATITRYVDPNAAAGGDGTTSGLSGSTCAYASMSIWEAAQQQDLTDGGGDIAECICDSNGGAADTTAVTIDGWTTSATSYITIHTLTSSRHDGKWNTGKYRLEISTGTAITNLENYVRVEGLQIHAQQQANSTHGFNGTGTSGKMVIKANIIRGSATDHIKYGIVWNNNGTDNEVYNNIVYDFTTSGRGIWTPAGFSQSTKVYNNTIHNCGTGIYNNFADRIIAKNNLIRSCGTACSGTFGSGTDYNATDNSSMGYTVTGGGNTHDRVSQTFTFVDESGDDFHLSSSDAGALDFGVSDPGSGLFSDDIDGETRSGSWDIGADEYISSGTDVTVTPAVQSGTFNTNSIGFILDQVLSIAAQSSAFSIPAISFSTEQILAQTVQMGSFVLNAPTVSISISTTVGVNVGTFSVETIGLLTDQILALAAQEATFSIPAITVLGGGDVAVTLTTPQTLVAALNTPGVVTDCLLDISSKTLTFVLNPATVSISTPTTGVVSKVYLVLGLR